MASTLISLICNCVNNLHIFFRIIIWKLFISVLKCIVNSNNIFYQPTEGNRGRVPIIDCFVCTPQIVSDNIMIMEFASLSHFKRWKSKGYTVLSDMLFPLKDCTWFGVLFFVGWIICKVSLCVAHYCTTVSCRWPQMRDITIDPPDQDVFNLSNWDILYR